MRTRYYNDLETRFSRPEGVSRQDSQEVAKNENRLARENFQAESAIEGEQRENWHASSQRQK